MTGLDVRTRAPFDLRRMSVTKQTATVTHDRAGQAFEIINWMKLCLAWKTQRDAGVERLERSAGHFFYSGKSGSMRRRQLVLE